MLGILLTVLKIIGWTILGILGFILFLLALVLFVPIRYKITGYKNNEEENNMLVMLKVTWLMHLFNLRVRYPSDELIRARIFLFKIFPKKEKVKKEKPKREKKKKDKKSNNLVDIKEYNNEEKLEETLEENLEDNIDDNKDLEEIGFFEEDINEKEESQELFDEEGIDETDELEKKKLIEKIYIYLTKVADFLKKIKEKVNSVYNKVIDIKNNITYYIDILKSDTFKRAFDKAKSQILKIFKLIKPKKLKGRLEFGFEDPSTTGMVYGIYSVIYPFLGGDLTVLPYFNVETMLLNGNILIRGRITVFSLLKIGFKVFFDKDIKRLIKMLKKESNNG